MPISAWASMHEQARWHIHLDDGHFHPFRARQGEAFNEGSKWGSMETGQMSRTNASAAATPSSGMPMTSRGLSRTPRRQTPPCAFAKAANSSATEFRFGSTTRRPFSCTSLSSNNESSLRRILVRSSCLLLNMFLLRTAKAPCGHGLVPGAAYPAPHHHLQVIFRGLEFGFPAAALPDQRDDLVANAHSVRISVGIVAQDFDDERIARGALAGDHLLHRHGVLQRPWAGDDQPIRIPNDLCFLVARPIPMREGVDHGFPHGVRGVVPKAFAAH